LKPCRYRQSAAALFAAGVLAFVPAARAEVPSAREIARVSPSGNYLAARHANTARDMAAAVAYYRAALRADPRNEELIERTFLTMLASGSVEESFPLADRLVGIEKSHRMARLALAVRAIKRGQYAAARTHLNQAVRGPIADLTATLVGAWAQFGANDAKGAVENIDRLSGPDWYAIFKDLHSGLVLDAAGQRREAGRRLEKALRADANALRVVDAYARWASRAGERDAALAAYADFSRTLPGHPLVEAALAELKAGRTLNVMVRTPAAGAAEVLYGLGSALGRQGGEDLGLVYLQLALFLDPEHPIALIALADLYENLKKPEQAIEVYARVPQNSPLRRNAEIHRALNLDLLDRTDEARKNLEALIKLKPDDYDANFALANVLRSRKHYPEAAEVYSRVVALIPKPERAHWTLFYFRGISYERSKQWPLAEKDFELALKLMPDQPQVLNYLGYSWVDQGQNLDQALDMIRKAVSLRPNDGYIVDSLGWAYYRLGRFDDAVRELERAIELRPEDPTINDHLGDAYWKVDRKLESFFQWRHAKDLKPEPEDLEKILSKLKEGLKEDAVPQKAGAVTNPGGG
jgi:tetratricopeptide (TPR) repeat protein